MEELVQMTDSVVGEERKPVTNPEERDGKNCGNGERNRLIGTNRVSGVDRVASRPDVPIWYLPSTFTFKFNFSCFLYYIDFAMGNGKSE